MAGSHGPVAGPERLRRELGLADAVAIFVGVILGSGVFVAPAAVARAAPSAPASVALWILGALVAGCGALCYAECAARLPRSGGFFIFYRAAYGDALAFVAGWTAALVTYPA
jgi:APA family basic amino acid/polyamine antiporter